MIRARCWLGLRPGPSLLGSHVSPARYTPHPIVSPLSCCRHLSPCHPTVNYTHAVLIPCLLLVQLWVNGCVDQQQWISLLRSDLFHIMSLERSKWKSRLQQQGIRNDLRNHKQESHDHVLLQECDTPLYAMNICFGCLSL
jgi:hypothetical protein